MDEDDGYSGEPYDPYASSRSSQESKVSRQPTRRRQPQEYIEEEDEDDFSDYDDDNSLDDAEFEMIPTKRGPPARSRTTSRRPPEVRKFRVKVHAEDVRYIMVGGAVEFPDFVDRIRDKFGLRRRFKVTIRDDDSPDGDMITMGDQDDLDIAISTAKDAARKQRQDVGKMEVWIKEV